ncbi:zf-TFIIB domain-containing protein [Bdellovibrio sp. SKB1291214]|uniref:TFIIB-type zinc ribbon-containing protein n=1 Tax=Bdellovibrio sp. SKB1291214 TaxID=1732569 RepID=UPI000B51DA3E|nr:zf-TFIIB domain-containing protein [Bdellovibrio sp. SKB1291214]UYL09336.1 zf-TFIIB domain-containing protein [Bdellovibrio sp. SKB1291214]
MKCPHCKDKDLVMSERKGVEIDYCPDCRGIWLDRGELDKILERSQREDESLKASPQQQGQQAYQSQPSYAESSYGGSYGHKPYKRKKSFFEELFD